MTSKPVAQLLVDLGVTRSHSRPHVSNDNPYSEAAFKTLKDTWCSRRTGSLPDPRAFADASFGYGNHEHHSQGSSGCGATLYRAAYRPLVHRFCWGVVHVARGRVQA